MVKKFFVYIISSKIRRYIYIGLSENIEHRVSRHNTGKERTTKPYAPFELIHQEVFSTRIEARKREKQLKTGSGKEWIKKNLM